MWTLKWEILGLKDKFILDFNVLASTTASSTGP